jgi:hypothetical protein
MPVVSVQLCLPPQPLEIFITGCQVRPELQKPTQEVTVMSHPGNLIPAELAEIIATHRALFGGYTMTAAPAEPAAPAAGAAPVVPAAPAVPPVVAPIVPAVTPPPAVVPPVVTPPANETETDKIARLERDLAAARQEAGKSRVNAKAAAAEEARTALVNELGKALGLVKDDTPTDPAVLQQQIAATGTENATLKAQAQAAETRLVAILAAITAGANPVALLDSNSFLKALDGLAPTDTEKITAAITAAITANPLLNAQVASKSGPEFTGGPGGLTKPTTLEEAVAAKLAAAS